MRTAILIPADDRGRPEEVTERFARWLSLLLRRSDESVTVVLSGCGKREPRFSLPFKGESAVAGIPLVAVAGAHETSPDGERWGQRLDSLLALFDIVYVPRRGGIPLRESPRRRRGDGRGPVWVQVTLEATSDPRENSAEAASQAGSGGLAGHEREEGPWGDVVVRAGDDRAEHSPVGVVPPLPAERTLRLPGPPADGNGPVGVGAAGKAWLALHGELTGRTAGRRRESSRGETALPVGRTVGSPSAECSENRGAWRIDRQRVTPGTVVPPSSGDGRLELLLVGGFAPFPPVTGAQVREWELIRSLSGRHRLTVAALVGDNVGEAGLRSFLRPVCERAYGATWSEPMALPGLPRRLRQFVWPTFWTVLETLSRRPFDAVVFDGLMMAPYRELFQTYSVLTEHNIESRLMEQMARLPGKGNLTVEFDSPAEQAALLRDYEAAVWPRFPLRGVVSENDRLEMDRRVSTGKTLVLENGTRIDRALPPAESPPRALLFMGILSYYPNIDGLLHFVEDILPRVSRRLPGTRLIVAGREPGPEIRRLGENPHVEVIADPPDMFPLAGRSGVAVVPLRIGSGTRIKILESMAWGLPVVSTRAGAEGLAVENGVHLLLRDDPDDFADAVVEVLEDSALRQRLQQNARRLVCHRYAWDRVFEPLHRALLEELT